MVVKVWRVFLQEGADMFARGRTVRAAAIQPSIRVNGYNARSVAYKVEAAVIVIIYAAAAIRTIFQVAGVVRGSSVVAVDNFLAIHGIYLSYFYFVPSLGTIIL